MPNDDDDMSAIADMSAAHAVDRAMPSFLYARLERGALETQKDGGSARTSEHPVALVQRAENRLALRRLERGSAGRRRDRGTPT